MCSCKIIEEGNKEDIANYYHMRTSTTKHLRAVKRLVRVKVQNRQNHLLDISCALFYRATQIKTYSWDNAQVVLVGNKCDLEDDRLVPTEDGQRLAEDLGTI